MGAPTRILASVLRIGLVLVVLFIGLLGYNLFKHSRQQDAANNQAAAAVRATLAEKFLVEKLPTSLHDLHCQGYSLNCGPGLYVTQCFMTLNPKDFDTLFDHARFRENAVTERAKTLFEPPVPADFAVTQEFMAHSDDETWGTSIYPNPDHDIVGAVVTMTADYPCGG